MSQSGTNQGSSRHSARGMRRRCVSLLTAASLCLALLTTGQTALGAEITDAGESTAAAVSEVTTSADAQITSSATQEITIVGSEDSTSEDTTTTESESSTSENQTSEESAEESETEDTSADTTETEESDSTSEESEESSENSEDTDGSEDSEDAESSDDSEDDSEVSDEEEDDELISEDEDSEEEAEDDSEESLSVLTAEIDDIDITLELENGFDEDWELSASSLSTSSYESLIDTTLPEDTEETTVSNGSSESYETDSEISDSDDSDDAVITTTVETSYSAEVLSAISLSLTDGEGNSASLASEADLTFRGDVLEAGESSTTTKTYTTYSTSSENTKGEDLSNASTNESTDSVNSADSGTTDSVSEENTVTVTVTTETTEEVRLYVLSSDGSLIQNTETVDNGSVTLSTQDLSPIYTFARVTECVVTTVTSEGEVDEDEEITLVSDTEVDGITVSVTGTRAALNGATGVEVSLISDEDAESFEDLLNEETESESGEDAEEESDTESGYSLYFALDISLTDGKETVEPKDTVAVTFSGDLVDEAVSVATEMAEDEDIEEIELVVVHFEENDETAGASETGSSSSSDSEDYSITIYGSEEDGDEGLVISDSSDAAELSFETDSFSSYAVALFVVTAVEDMEVEIVPGLDEELLANKEYDLFEGLTLIVRSGDEEEDSEETTYELEEDSVTTEDGTVIYVVVDSVTAEDEDENTVEVTEEEWEEGSSTLVTTSEIGVIYNITYEAYLESDSSASSDDGVSTASLNDSDSDEGALATASTSAEVTLFDGYISSLSVSVADGTEPFDDKESSSDSSTSLPYMDSEGNWVYSEDGSVYADEPGNDSSDSNGYVRTFDDIIYSFSLSIQTINESTTLETATIHFESQLDKDLTRAKFDTTQMAWLSDWEITYYDENDEVVLIQTENGIFEEDGTTVSSFNDVAGDSSKDVSYGSSVTYQVLTGTYTKNADDKAAWEMQQITVGVMILASANGDTVQPTFNFWIEGNEDNLGRETDENGNSVAVDHELSGDDVPVTTVSGAARYNLVLKSASDTSYASWFNFETGQEGSSDDNESLYGRMVAYGITIELFNESNNSSILSEKGLKGVELPVGEITFDLTLTTEAKGATDADNYTPVLWEYNENLNSATTTYDYANAKYTGNWGRNLYWGYETRTPWAKGAAPANTLNSGGGTDTSCYFGGAWSVSGIAYGEETVSNPSSSNPSKVTGDGSDTVYTFTVSGFDFDFDDWHYPVNCAGQSGTTSWLSSNFVGAFSAGHIQVLQQYPAVADETVTISLTATLSNISATNLDGESVDEETESYSSSMGGTGDNSHVQTIQRYVSGTLSKGNSFTESSSTSYSSKFLGTGYWTTSYDCSAIVGSDIALWGYGILSTASDGYIRAMNLLQLFDSEVLKITEGGFPSYYPGFSESSYAGLSKGTETFLYVADPLFPEGYDTNGTTEKTDADNNSVTAMDRMNSVSEEDLLYFEDLNSLEDAGYVCVGVLMEIRECKIIGGIYVSMKIPLTVRTTKLSTRDSTPVDGTTVCSVNAVRVWVSADDEYSAMDDITWADAAIQAGESEGTVSSETSKNIENYILSSDDGNNNSKIDLSSIDGYMTSTNHSRHYIKTEYDFNGQQISGTHYSGTVYGISLLTVGYEASVSIDVTNIYSGTSSADSSSGTVIFDYGNGETTATYTISGISTSAGTSSGTESDRTDTTNLVITSTVPDGLLIDHGEGAFTIVGVDEDGNECTYCITAVDEDDYDADTTKGTTITYVDSSGNTYTYTIVAVISSDYQTVTFYLSGVTIDVELPDITYTATLTATVENNAYYTATVSIAGDGDARSFDANHGNYDSESFQVVSLVITSLSKSVGSELVEKGEDIVFYMTYSNVGSADASDICLLDILPYNSDYWGSDFSGSYTVTEIVVDFSGATDTFFDELESNEVEVLYTTDEEVRTSYSPSDTDGIYETLSEGMTSSSTDGATSYVDSENISWSEVSLNLNSDSYAYSWSSDTDDGLSAAAIYVSLGLLKVDDSVEVEIVLTPTIKSTTNESGETIYDSEQDAGDLYRNVCFEYASGQSYSLQSNLVGVQVVERTISGLTWYDANSNGLQDENEDTISGITVSLYRDKAFTDDESEISYILTLADDSTVTLYAAQDVFGNAVNPVMTDKNGGYEFNNLLAGAGLSSTDSSYSSTEAEQTGTYYLIFTSDSSSSGYYDWESYYLTTQDVGDNAYDTLDSDAAMAKTLKNGSSSTSSTAGLLSALTTVSSAAFSLGSLKAYAAESSVSSVLSSSSVAYIATTLQTIEEISEDGDYTDESPHNDLGITPGGYLLPETGGNGTIPYAAAGAGIIALAGVVWVYKRRHGIFAA